MEIRKLSKDLIRPLDEYLKSDPVRNAYLIHDLHKERDKSDFYLALEDSEIIGVLLLYHGHRNPTVWIRGRRSASEELLKTIEPNEAIFTVPPNLAGEVQRQFPTTDTYQGDVMTLRSGEENVVVREPVESLSPDHAEEVGKLFSEWRGGNPSKHADKFRRGLKSGDSFFYGKFAEGRLVSMCNARIRFGNLASIGGTFTLPKHRERGYAMSCLSKCLEAALEEVGKVGLFVRSDNVPAKKLYKKVGFEKNSEVVWLDLNTGFVP